MAPPRNVTDAIAAVAALAPPPNVAPWKRDRRWCRSLRGVFERLGPVAVMEMIMRQRGSVDGIPKEIKAAEVEGIYCELRGACFEGGGTLPAERTADVAITCAAGYTVSGGAHRPPKVTGSMKIRDYRNEVIACSGNHPLQDILDTLCLDAQATFAAHVQDAVEAADLAEEILEQNSYDISVRDAKFEEDACAAIEALSHMTDGRAFDAAALPRIHAKLPEWARDERFAAAVARGKNSRHRW